MVDTRMECTLKEDAHKVACGKWWGKLIRLMFSAAESDFSISTHKSC